MTTEYVTLTATPGPEILSCLLTSPGGAALSIQHGLDSSGQPRSVITITHTDADMVAATRQNLLRACLRAGLQAYVV